MVLIETLQTALRNRRRYETHAEAKADIFDYIECFYNPRRRRKLQIIKQKKSNLTQPSVVVGLNPIPLHHKIVAWYLIASAPLLAYGSLPNFMNNSSWFGAFVILLAFACSAASIIAGAFLLKGREWAGWMGIGTQALQVFWMQSKWVLFMVYSTGGASLYGTGNFDIGFYFNFQPGVHFELMPSMPFVIGINFLPLVIIAAIAPDPESGWLSDA